MNIPTKVLRSTYITYETYYHHQQLAKRFYKSSTKSSSKSKSGNPVEEINLNFINKQSYKEELLKWFFSMSLPDRIKAVSIENKWFSTMVQHMHYKSKQDNRTKFQLKLEEISTEEYCLQQIFNQTNNPYSNEMNLESFFNIKTERNIPDDRIVNENLFLKEIRYFTLKEQNDTISLSTNILQNEEMFKYYMEQFSMNKCFNSFCTVSYDNILRVYNWDFPEWFNSREFNSVSEFIIAYIEQVLSIRYWFAVEEKKEKMLKKINVTNFSLCEEPNFNELFNQREKIIHFLRTEFKTSRDTLFNQVVNLRDLLADLRNDTNIMSKVKKPKPDHIKNYFYIFNKAKYELFDAPLDPDHEIIDRFKRCYYENSEETFVDELIFCRIESLYSIEDFLAKKLFDVLHNIYTERIANDLMNEELGLKKNNSDNQKKSKKKNANKKKKGGSDNEITPKSDSFESAENKLHKSEISLTSSDSTHKSSDHETTINHKPILSAMTIRKDYPIDSTATNTQDKEEVKTQLDQSRHVVLTVKNTKPQPAKTNVIDESQKMSWRKKKVDDIPYKDSKTQPNPERSLTSNNYVNNLVKSLINQVVYGPTPDSNPSNDVSKVTESKEDKDLDKKEDKGLLKPSAAQGEKRNKNKKNKNKRTNNNNGSDCIIETINHQIIKPGKKMVDSYSQTDNKHKYSMDKGNFNSLNESDIFREAIESGRGNESARPNDEETKPIGSRKVTMKENRSMKKVSAKDEDSNGKNVYSNDLKTKQISNKNYLDLKKCASDGYTFGVTTPKRGKETLKKEVVNKKVKPIIDIKYNSSVTDSCCEEEEYTYHNPPLTYNSVNYHHNKNYSKHYKIPSYNQSPYTMSNKFSNNESLHMGHPKNFFASNSYNNFFCPNMMTGYGMPFRTRGDFPRRDNHIYNNYYIINSNVNINNITHPKDSDRDHLDKTVRTENDGRLRETSHNTRDDSYNILNKIEKSHCPFIFHYRLHNDIIDYSNSVNEVISYLKDIKIYIINYLKIKVKESLQFDVIFDLYGSFATDLSIESSDIDITIKFQDDNFDSYTDHRDKIEEFITKLCIDFENLEGFEYVNPILTASVPVLKILVDPTRLLPCDSQEYKKFAEIKEKDFFKNYKFDLEELLKVKVDLTFIELSQSLVSNTRGSLEWARKTLSLYPEIKPIVHSLKRYLQIKKLNSSFNGGLSSYSLFLLLVAYIKYSRSQHKTNLGRLFMEFFEFYGKFFNYAQTLIDVNSYIPYIFKNEFLEVIPCILDPVTGLNVAKNSYRIDEVRDSFSKVHDFLSRSKILFDKNDMPSTTNVVLDLMLRCNESC